MLQILRIKEKLNIININLIKKLNKEIIILMVKIDIK